MMTELEKAKKYLKSGGFTCVLCKDEAFYTSTQRGVKPLVIWISSCEDLRGYYAADKVVGKATAFLYVLLGVRAVYADVISRSALDTLNKYNINVQYGIIVENIINRNGDGICPFEAAVLSIDEPNTAYEVILKKMKEMNISF